MPGFKMPPIDEKPQHGVAAYKRDMQERVAQNRKQLERSERLLRMVEENVPVLEFLELANTPIEE